MSNVEIYLDPEPDTPVYPLTPPKKKYTLIVDSDFTGRIEIHCRDGGIAGVEKIERLKSRGKVYR